MFGKQSGTATGPFRFSNGDKAVTLTPSHPFLAGEVVHVNLSHAVGAVWKLVLGDVDGDGKLDVAAVNGNSGSVATLLGGGDGSLGLPAVISTSGAEVGTVLGDLDGDGDLDLALTDETSDHTRIFQNGGGPAPDCPPAPDTCRPPTVGGASSAVLQQKSPADKSHMAWKWGKGTATTKAEFGDPTGTDGYTLRMYDAGALVSTSRVTGSCPKKPCWASKATEVFKGKGISLALPDPASLVGPIDVQLRTSPSGLCWGGTSAHRSGSRRAGC